MVEATDRLVDACRALAGDALREVAVFDQRDHETLFAREDVAARREDRDVATIVDNERYGYVERRTYADAFREAYGYTVRGIGDAELFRTFVGDTDRVRVGVLVEVDVVDGGHDFAALDARVRAIAGEHSTDALGPAP
jgi:hypothetical protein